MRVELVTLILALLTACASAPATTLRPADLLLRGGRVHTLDAAQPTAQAVAVRAGEIVFVGSDAEALPWIGTQTEIVELAGRTLLPGFADAHLHLSGHGRALRELDLTGTRSWAEVVARVQTHAARRPEAAWILGRGWDQNDWDVAEFPDHAELSAALPDRPVALTRIDGHALLVNAAALRAAGLDGETADPPGGRILRRADGRPSGVLIDRAMELVTARLPAQEPAELRAEILAAVADLQQRGITAVHDAGLGLAELAVLEALARAGELGLRVHAMLSAEVLLAGPTPAGLPSKDLTGHGVLAVRAVKAYADGALGSRGAALLAPYADEPQQAGLLLMPADELRALAERCLREGFQLCVHAIGDRGNRLALDAIAAALAAVPAAQRTGEHRFRIEHAQVVAPEEFPRFAKLGVIASVQPQHQTSDMPWAEARLGPQRVRGAYAWRRLLEAGAALCGGSDAPVERPAPLTAFQAAITRSDEAGQPAGGWYPDQALTRNEALALLTRWPAFAAFEEHRLGSIAVGLRADLVVLAEDPLQVEAARLPEITVALTIFDGRIVHRAQP
ncbi:MAG: amidohydrolase [Planctomycetota bacterium]